jgi:hypothetical protein
MVAGPALLALCGWVFPADVVGPKRGTHTKASAFKRRTARTTICLLTMLLGVALLVFLLLFSAVWHLFPAIQHSPNAGLAMLTTLAIMLVSGFLLGIGLLRRSR